MLVDTERKVARAATARGSPLAGAAAIVSRAGRGGNWAYGYHGVTDTTAVPPSAHKQQRWVGTGGVAAAADTADDDASVLARALEAIRTEAERNGVYGYVVVHSLVGWLRLCAALEGLAPTVRIVRSSTRAIRVKKGETLRASMAVYHPMFVPTLRTQSSAPLPRARGGSARPAGPAAGSGPGSFASSGRPTQRNS